MILDIVRRASIYQNYVQPIVWAPIKAYRVYREFKKDHFYRMLARQDTVRLAQARADREEFYANETEPVVSITTATYNRARILTESTLPAVLAQTYPRIEWIIVGDHCTDDTAERLAKIDDPRVRFFNLPRRPRYPKNPQKRYRIVGTQAINLAHDIARGSWVAHLDDDDVFTPDHIEKLLAHARTGNYEFVSGLSRLEMRPGEWVDRGRTPSGSGDWPLFSHSCVLYRSYLGTCFRYDRTCLKVNVGGDAFRWQRMFNAGVRAGFVHHVVTLMPLRPGEMSRSIFQPE